MVRKRNKKKNTIQTHLSQHLCLSGANIPPHPKKKNKAPTHKIGKEKDIGLISKQPKRNNWEKNPKDNNRETIAVSRKDI